ncbi:hypothetical protein NKL07_11240 [Mesorhizobium sp. C280B]|uniref:hypothetical protein n=1 Tax=Mesorhizobium sp. C280B TaxID=2956828 RepID=UPI00333B13DD
MFRWAEILIDTSLWIFVARRFVNAAAKFLPHSGNFVWNQIEHAAFLRLRGVVSAAGDSFTRTFKKSVSWEGRCERACIHKAIGPPSNTERAEGFSER